MSGYKVGGFFFEDEKSAKEAAKDLKVINYVKEKTKGVKPGEGTLRIYDQLIDKKAFTTDIGKNFLSDMRQSLLDCKEVDNFLVRNIDGTPYEIPDDIKEESSEEKVSVSKKIKKDSSLDKELEKLKRINSVLLTLCIGLTVIIIGMFIINSTIDSPTILNYEEKIVNQYSTWEQELEAREQAVSEKERALNKK